MKNLYSSVICFLSLLSFSNSTYAACPGEVEIIVQITPDNYPQEISWDLRDQSNAIIASGFSIGDTLCVPIGECVTFTIYDSFGDGICCAYGNGSYTIYADGTPVATGGNYTNSQSTSLNCPPGTSCASGLVIGTGNYTAPGANTWYEFTPTLAGMYVISTCDVANTCNTKIWIYDHCANLVWNNTNQGTLYYDDDNGGCGQLAVVSAALDPSQTYYIRIGDNAGSCGTNSIEWFIQYSGPIIGCMDASACNYNPLATVSSGVCYYYPDPNCPNGPDLLIEQTVLENSMSWDQITASNCWVQESCLNGYGTRDIIRFTTHIKNIGALDYYVGNPTNNPTQFSFVNCHNHPHYEGYAEYILYQSTGATVPIGFKNGFCVMDLECSGGGSAQYGCSNMGITAGCGDIYSAGLDCQWIDITDVTPGDYILAVKVNWDQSPDALGHYESDYLNNWAQVCITIFVDGNGFKNFSINSTCAPYVDCAGTPYGNATIDCNGNCGGTAKMGDLDNNLAQEIADAQVYVDEILDYTINASNCNDLNADGDITVFDASLITNCDLNGTQFNGNCTFPSGVHNPNHMVELTIDTLNLVDGYIDIYMRNPTARVSAMEFDVSGINILNVLPLYNTIDYPFNPQFRVNGNKIVLLSTNDSSILKSNPFQPLIRVYYSAITGNNVCIGSIQDIVSSVYETTNTNIINGCINVTGIAEEVDINNYMIVYPNPTQGMITVEVHTSIGENNALSVKNLLGETVFSEKIPANNSSVRTIDLSSVANGIYYINYISEGKTLVKKIVVNH